MNPRRFIIAYATLVVALSILLSLGWYYRCAVKVWPESQGLVFTCWRELPEYKLFEATAYFDQWGFKVGNGWIGGFVVGEGQFLISEWIVVVPYWFCAAVMLLIVGSVRWRRSRKSG